MAEQTKVTKLTALNVRAIRETIPEDLGVSTTDSTATFNMDAASAAQLVLTTISRLSGKGHPKASLHAVARKLVKERQRQMVENAESVGVIDTETAEPVRVVMTQGHTGEAIREALEAEQAEFKAGTGRPEGGWDHAADFLLKTNWPNLFEPTPDEEFYKCKGCRAKVGRRARKEHFAHHKATVITRASDDAERRPAKMAAKQTKQTAKDQGVPSAYLSDSGNFKPGLDARFKSDLINSVLGIKDKNSLQTFTEEKAMEFLQARNWVGFLTRKREILAAKEQAKADAKAKKSESTRAAASAKNEVKPDPKPAPSRRSSGRGGSRGGRKPSTAKK